MRGLREGIRYPLGMAAEQVGTAASELIYPLKPSV